MPSPTPPAGVAATPALGASALGFVTPSQPALSLNFAASPLPGALSAASAPAPDSARVASAGVLGGGKRPRKTVIDKSTGGPHVLPARGELGDAGGAKRVRVRGKRRARTAAPTVGAAQRLGPNLVNFNDAAQQLAVEGTVKGDAGKQHWAVTCGVAVLAGRVPQGSKGGPVSQAAKAAAVAAPVEAYVMLNDTGRNAGPGRFSRRSFGLVLQRASNLLLQHQQSPGAFELNVQSVQVVLAPRTGGLAPLGGFEVSRAAAAAHAAPDAASGAGGVGRPSHATVVQQLHDGLAAAAGGSSSGAR